MIAYIKGQLSDIGEDYVVVETGNIGYEIKVPASLFTSLPPVYDETKLYTYLHVREDAMVLYGFLTVDDMEVFKLLLTVNGIGPKGALGVLSAMTGDDLRLAVFHEDTDMISKAPGIGKKTAQKLILDLKDKLKLKGMEGVSAQKLSRADGQLSHEPRQEAIMALTSLGYTYKEATQALDKVVDVSDVEGLIKGALKQLALF